MQTAMMVVNTLKELNIISISFRIVLAVICGGVIGAERGRAHQLAGMRTYMLVCLGSTLVMSTGQYMYNTFEAGDPARLGAQVISGIGFLGAGSIIISGKTRVRGLTTAAGLWTAASIGLALGIGFYSAGILATAAVYMIMTRLKKMEYQITSDTFCYGVYVEYTGASTIASITQKIFERGLEIEEVQIGKQGKKTQKALLILKCVKNETRETIQKMFEAIEGVTYFKYLY